MVEKGLEHIRCGKVVKALDFEERKLLEENLKRNYTMQKIARIMNRSGTGLTKEVKKNGGRLKYNAIEAQKRADFHRENRDRSNYQQGKFYKLDLKITNLEMQMDILVETIKELRNGNIKN
jgi:IS30 family transposase